MDGKKLEYDFSIPDNPAAPNHFKTLVDSHGEIDLDKIMAFEEKYVDLENRSAQDVAQL